MISFVPAAGQEINVYIRKGETSANTYTNLHNPSQFACVLTGKETVENMFKQRIGVAALALSALVGLNTNAAAHDRDDYR